MERLDAFMARANAAYYATHDPFRDFTTSPEITQVFGEILGLWAAVVWQQIGRPDPVLLVEAGPGRGTLMADALRAIGQAAPAFGRAVSVHLIETSPRLRAEQAKRVQGATWHDGLATVPHQPFILLANEFLDALPIRQILRRGETWQERYVDGGRFVEVPTDPVPLASSDSSGFIFELNEAALAFVEAVSNRLSIGPGSALFLDYGPEHSAPGDSLQAVGDGRPVDPLAEPGTADLTAHVDFEALAHAARKAGATPYGPVPQGVFLTRLGLFQRTGRLARSQPPERASALIEAARRLAEPNRMGRLFKAMALGARGISAPPGFE
ncbi:MAG TPA: SAM-dependent methyltransferase [Acetobacteraceae bacterium]|nr:SAM-dependent methyltransferase [Acetobacteraceae bacterium]